MSIFSEMDVTYWTAVLGSFSSIIGLVIAIIQTLRFKNAKRSLRMLKRHRSATIWSNIAMLLEAYETIDEARNLIKLEEPVVYAKISSARRSIINQYLQHLKEAVLDEEDFTEETVDLWVQSGKLENDWRVAQARKFIGIDK